MQLSNDMLNFKENMYCIAYTDVQPILNFKVVSFFHVVFDFMLPDMMCLVLHRCINATTFI